MEAPASRTPPLDPSKCNSTVETMRCSRCAMSAETVSHNGRDVSADDARAGGMVKFGHNLARSVAPAISRARHRRGEGTTTTSFPMQLHGSSGKVRASLLPSEEHSRHSRGQQRQERWSIIRAASISTTAGTFGIAPASQNATTSGTSVQLFSMRNTNLNAQQQQHLIELQKLSSHCTHSLSQVPPLQTRLQMPKLPPPYRPDFETETALATDLLEESWLAFLTTALSLMLLGCFLVFLLRLSVLWDRRLARDGYVGGVPREEKILRRCEERGRRICKERGIWDVGFRGGPPARDCEVDSADEKRMGKKLRFLSVPEVIPPPSGMGNVHTTREKDKGKGKERQRTRSHSSHISNGHHPSDDLGTYGLASVAGVTARRRASSMTSEREWPLKRRASADWVSGGEETVRFFGAGSWIGRVRNRRNNPTAMYAMGVAEPFKKWTTLNETTFSPSLACLC
ncbi:hypothetical protein V490_08110 [Pseudogymnoascus sp. VKM F-3557]|nr:hypothetical protein V490_08110 [Pseudogymnoascus sp. VKM F-3557]